MSLHALLTASLATTPHQSPIRFNTTWGNCPEPGEVFNALTAHGVVVRVEVDEDEAGIQFIVGKDDRYSIPDLIGWWRDPPEPAYQPSERQEAAEYHAEEEDNQRQYEEIEE